jgi:hypothetical protein
VPESSQCELALNAGFPSVDAPISASDLLAGDEHVVGCCHLSGF